MNRYTEGQKEATLQRMVPPQNQPVKQISEEMGIPVATLYLWRRKAQDEGIALRI
ncbi:Transposase [Sulfidibacter corallicola]|uniref:Transposase n=1 Tax=Sulfidibacter corallicola TaxID=2818388 RepID=A0A8A4TZ59_SULCO|nr:transposase [Sulfidibacter corallicola]QTD54232.1 transposase [Sulfidibacter corallicola]